MKIGNDNYKLAYWTFEIVIPTPLQAAFPFGAFTGGNSVLNGKYIFSMQTFIGRAANDGGDILGVSVTPANNTLINTVAAGKCFLTWKYEGCSIAEKIPLWAMENSLFGYNISNVFRFGVGSTRDDAAIMCDRGRIINFQDCQVEFANTTGVNAGESLLFLAAYWDKENPNVQG